MSDSKPVQATSRPRFWSLVVEWVGIVVFAVLAGQFLAALLSLVVPSAWLAWLVWVPTPLVVFALLSFRLRGSSNRYAWPGPSGLWWSLLAMLPGAWLGALVGQRLYPSMVGCGGDCQEAALTGFLIGASLLGLTAMITVFSWRATVAAAGGGE